MKNNLKTTTMNFSQTNKRLFVFVFALLSLPLLQAQPQNNDRIQANKIAFFTNKLNLSPKQAEQFWPLFNEFESKRKELRGTYKESIGTPQAELNDNQAKEEIKKILLARQREVDLEKEYADKFMQVISPKQVFTLLQSEKEFTRMLVKRLREKRRGKEF